MKIALIKKDKLAVSAFKLPREMKAELKRIAKSEKLSESDIVRAFLNYAIKSYEKKMVVRVGDDRFMEKFREKILIGDTVIAAGILGKIKKFEDPFVELQVAKGVTIKIFKDEITDLIHPPKGRKLPVFKE